MTFVLRNHYEQERRIAITGLGIVSPLGRTTGRFWECLTSPPATVETAERSPGTADFEGRIEDFDELPPAIKKTIRKSLKLMNRETQLGVAAGQQALLNSRILENYEPDRMGICFGAGNVSVMPEDFQSAVEACLDEEGDFELDRWGPNGISEIAPLWLLKCLPNMPTCHLAIINDLRGPNNTITQRDVSFALAIAEACRTIRSEDADAMLVGATGTTLNSINLVHARLENEVSDHFDSADSESHDECNGMPFPSEGAGAIILEDLHAARQRGATIYGEVLGAASASCLGHDGASAGGHALAGAMRQALRRAGLLPSDIGHIHAHARGSAITRAAESQAINDVFGSTGLSKHVVTTNGRLGNAGPGTGAMEMVASLLVLEHGCVFPSDAGDHLDGHRLNRSVNHGGGAVWDSFLSLSMVGRGLGSCIAVGTSDE